MLADIIAKELGIGVKQVRGTMELLMDGATVPFIARYRKEATGSLDEVAIGKIKELHEKYSELQRRKETVIATIEEQGKLTEELKNQILSAETMVVVGELRFCRAGGYFSAFPSQTSHTRDDCPRARP